MRAPLPVERAAVGLAGRLPARIQRRLSGRPVVREGQTLAPDLQLLLRLQRLAGPPAETLPINEARASVLRACRACGGRQPIGSVRDLVAGGRPARLYVPSGAGGGAGAGAGAGTRAGAGAGPLLVFLHGGGFFSGDLDTHDAPCRVLAERARTRVLSVDYRLGPEHPFPAAYDDAVAAYRWAVDHAAELGADPRRIGVGGDSAGGNLAAGIAVLAAREGLPCAVQLLAYPVVSRRLDTVSARTLGAGFYLTTEFMDLADRSYFPGGARRDDDRFNLTLVDLPALADRLAPALVYTAGFDPLRDEGEEYAHQLMAAGVDASLRRFPGLIHGFLNLPGASPSAAAAIGRMADDLGEVLGAAGTAGGRGGFTRSAG